MTVTVFSTKTCQRCRVVAMHLDRIGVPFTEVKLEDDIEQAKALRQQGFNLAPVVRAEVDGNVSWSEGYRPDFLDGLRVPAPAAS